MMPYEVEIDFDWSNCPESGNLHLWLPPEVLRKIDAALETGSIHTREDFATAAVLWALDSLDAEDAETVMGLEDQSKS